MSDSQVFTELLPIEINHASLKKSLTAQLKKGITLEQILPAIEKTTLKKLKKESAKLITRSGKNLDKDYLYIKRATLEMQHWLDYLVESYLQLHLIPALTEKDDRLVAQLQEKLRALVQTLDTQIPPIVKYRAERTADFSSVFKSTIDFMELETQQRARYIILNYERKGEDYYKHVKKKFEQFFKHLRSQEEKISAYLQPKLPTWNVQVLHTGRGFYLAPLEQFPCSLLFSIRGSFHLIFENMWHLLGVGAEKMVVRSICLPEGKIHAMIKPLMRDQPTQPLEDLPMQTLQKEMQFNNMWIESEILLKLRKKRGVIHLEERMAFQINEHKAVFMIEDYYWDGSGWNYLKFLTHNQKGTFKLTSKRQKKLLVDLLSGLIEIHKHGILHHDIKLDNILLDFKKKKSIAVLTDFQLATYLHDTKRIAYLRILPAWSTPEYAQVQLQKDPQNALMAITTDKLDVWSLGLVFYCFIAYTLPPWFKDWDHKKALTEEEKELTYTLIASLQPGWLPNCLKTSPYFPLLEKMLEPNPKIRCSALEAIQLLNTLA